MKCGRIQIIEERELNMKLEKEGLVVTPLTEQKTGLWDMAFIWFCANVAVPRLMIGGSLASLGFGKLILILLAGNILVFLPLLALGVVGYNVRIPTMAATRMTFGVKGSYLPSVANGIQLLGWGANVTVICGSSINSIVKAMSGYSNLTLWIVVTGIVQLVITAYGVRSITWLQRVSVPLLAILTVVAAVLIVKNYGWASIANYTPVAAIGILAGLDIVASNAFAWGPMVCDYTRYAKSKGSSSWGTLIGSLAGAAGFMFVGAISFMTTGNANPVDMLLALGLGVPALLIIVLSSVTTNVMNLYSASISFVNVFPKAKPWKIIGIGGIIMTGIAIIPNLIGHFITFLVIVGSIFVPLIAIMLVDYFMIRKQKVDPDDLLVEDNTSKFWFKGGFNWTTIAVWLVGVALYNGLYYFWPVLGSCVPTFVVIGLLYYFVAKKK